MILRPYQQEAHDCIQAGWQQWRRQLAVMPTGGGKTILFAKLAASTLPERTLILAHREELLQQAVEKIQKATGIFARLERGPERAGMHAQVVVSSIQTMARRKAKWPRDHFSLIVVDEGHHILSDTYLKTLERFHDHARILAVTATPDRGDKKNLGKYLQNVAYETTLVDLILQGYLSRIRVKTSPLEIDMTGLRKVQGDYDLNDIAHKLSPWLGQIADEIAAECWDKKTMVFLPLVALSKNFTGLLNARGIECRHVDGASDDRKAVTGWFSKAGKGTCLCNAMLLTEGYDEPSVDCIVPLRLTQSRALYSQIIGRGTRISPDTGKQFLTILDFLFVTHDHSLVKPTHLIAADQEEAQEIERAISAGEKDLLQARESASKAREQKLAQRLAEVRHKPKGTFDALEFCLAIHDPQLATFVPTMSWHTEPATEAQLRILEKNGFWRESITGKGHATAILDRLFARRSLGLATPKQVNMLRKWGHANPELETFESASRWIDNALGARRGA